MRGSRGTGGHALITGILIWYDESPTWLMSTIVSMAPALDHLVAVDGAFALFPGAFELPHSGASVVEQSLAIVEACSATNLSLTLHRPRDPFEENEVQKRNLSIQLAASVSSGLNDWWLVFDADTPARYIAADFKEQVEKIPKRFWVADYGVYVRIDSQALKDRYGLGPNDRYVAESLDRVTALYRADPTLRYGPSHWHVSSAGAKGRTWLRGPQALKPQAPFDATQYLRVDHRNKEREPVRAERARDYYDRREASGIEKGDLNA